MTQPSSTVCPYIGLVVEPATARLGPDPDHRCYAQVPPGAPDEAYQERFCVCPGYTDCGIYTAAVKAGRLAPADETAAARSANGATPGGRTSSRPNRLRRVLPWVGLAALILIVVAVYARDTLGITPSGQTQPTQAAAAEPLAQASATQALPGQEPSAQPPVPSITPAASGATDAAGAAAQAPQDATATPEPGGRILNLAPKSGDAGWFGSAEARGNHLSDSYLYAGYHQGQALISAVRIGLANVPRGAPIREGRLELVGLDDGRFNPDAGGTWSVQFLAADALPDYTRATFQELLNAPAAVTLVPTLFAGDLAVGRANTWVLDAAGRAWLEQQLLDAADSVIARIVGPTGGSDTLFAWDSGVGPSTSGEGPRLVLDVGAPPPTPPALPTEAVIVATLTPTPANVLTAVVYALQATEQANSGSTPSPYRIVTPTPPADNLATAQAYGVSLGLPPLVVYTATPANAETAQADDWRATAVALTTGTFTPVPKDAVTPVIVLPTLQPRNAATALAQVLTATAEAVANGTPTPWGPYVLVATLTPTPVTPSPTPANQQTAIVRAAEATLTAMARSTQPLPVVRITKPEATAAPQGTGEPAAASTVAPTSAPTPTLTPTAAPTTATAPTPTRAAPTATRTPTPAARTATPAAARSLQGLILFRSDRGGGNLFALDPATSAVVPVDAEQQLTQAEARDVRAANGAVVFVREDGRGVPQLFVDAGGQQRQLTQTTALSYDPSWSPRSNTIAFVSSEPGNDEIYTIVSDGSDMRRLTSSLEFDKHPSWSPDGRRIVFWSNRNGGRQQLWVMNADGSGQRVLLQSQYNDWDPVWVK